MSRYSQFLFQSPLNEMSEKEINNTIKYHNWYSQHVNRDRAKTFATVAGKNQSNDDKRIIRNEYNNYINTQRKISNIKNLASKR